MRTVGYNSLILLQSTTDCVLASKNSSARYEALSELYSQELYQCGREEPSSGRGDVRLYIELPEVSKAVVRVVC